ncbi:uncharacterized protein LOC108733434 [Agrilus planipennis]|uniref:Uncharacterized protein LOC108733434 n=1 Tax=Agrilus planipennis TaxID=224129 RepID=A0A1W4WJ21_AGRPL|nr:uncharacterized protein LOC108733434 [Agrilus planipennis]XP_018320108.1 uncharacterized protein LOC108733434 [Agrilus planipennis]
MIESDQIEAVDVGVQTLLHCYEDNHQNIYVSSNRVVQTVISSIPLRDDYDDSIFIGLLGFIPYSEIYVESENIIVLPRKRKLQWADPFTMELSSDSDSIQSNLKYKKMEPARCNQETQTIIAVYPHVLDDGDVAHVMQNITCQTSITALPDESITNIVPILKQQLPHNSMSQKTTTIPKYSENNTTEPGNSEHPVTGGSNDAPAGSGTPDNSNLPEDSVAPEDSNLPEDSDVPENLKQSDEEQLPPASKELEENIPGELKEISEGPEKNDSCKISDPCSKSPCIEKVIHRDDCFENKVRGILQMAAEVFETEICEFFEEHPGEKKVALCKELFNFAGISGSKEADQWDKAVKDLDKIAAEGVNEENVFSSTPDVNQEGIVRPVEISPTNNNSGNCFCQKRTIKDVASPVKRSSKIPRLIQCCGKTANFCGNQQSSKIPVLTKRRSKVSQQIQPCVTSSGPGDCKEVRFSFNLPSPQLFTTIESKPQYEFNHRLPSAMKRSIQVGVGQCCSTRDGIEIQQVSSPEPIQNFVYECDAGYVESYLQSLGNEIKGCQTERTELGEGDWDWEEDEEEDPCLCDPWKKIAVPLPGTYVLKKTKKSSEEENEQTSTNDMDFLSIESKKLPTLELVKLPVYDPKYFKMTELYMEPLYDFYPMETEPEDVCGPETEMPWEDIVLPEKCRIKKANPTVCTCSSRKRFSVFSSDKNRKETDTNASSFGPDPCGTVNINATATTSGKSSTIIIHIKPPNEDDSNSNDSESIDSVCLKELPFYGISQSTGTCGCPKRQPSTDAKGKLPSKSPRSVLEIKPKKKTLDIPSNPPEGLHKIIKKVGVRPAMEEITCETQNKSTDTDKCDQATETISSMCSRNHATSKAQCKKSDLGKSCSKTPRQNPACRCRRTRSNSDCNNKNTKDISTCTSKTMMRQRAGASGVSKCSVGCGPGVYVSVAAAERDKHSSQSTSKKACPSSEETNTDKSLPKIRAIHSLKRIGQPNARICKDIPSNNEVFELFSKGQTKVHFGVKAVSKDSAGNRQSDKGFCIFESKPEDVNELETEPPSLNREPSSTKDDACSPSKPQRKYPVVAALNAFEEEMKPLRAALCQLQKRIYSLDLPEMQSRHS